MKQIKMKQIINVLLFVVLVHVNIDSVYSQEVTINEINYALNIDQATVLSSSLKDDIEIVIPSKINYGGKDYMVTAIGKEAFYGFEKLINVSLPESVISIGDNAFSRCNSLERINFPQALNIIGYRAFFGCSNLKKVELSDDMDEIDNRAFEDCTSLENIKMPQTLNTLGEGTFSGCSNLKHIVLPNNLQVIQERTFQCCRALQSVDMPQTLKQIKHQAFISCENLEWVHIPASVDVLEYAFPQCNKITNVVIESSNLDISHAYNYWFGSQVLHYTLNMKELRNKIYSDCKTISIGRNCTLIDADVLNNLTLDTLYLSRNIKSIGSQDDFSAKYITYEGSIEQWKKISNSSGIIPNDFFFGRIKPNDSFEKDGIYYCAIDTALSTASIIKGKKNYAGKLYIPKEVSIGEQKFRIIKIADNTFKDCKDIDSIFYEGNRVEWEKMIIGKNNDMLNKIHIVYNYKQQGIENVSKSNLLYIDNCEFKKGENRKLAIKLMNIKPITGLQFELKLPSGFSLSVNENNLYKGEIDAERSSNLKHDIFEISKLQSENYLVICGSTSNETFMGNEGTVISLYIDMDENVTDGDYTFAFKNITLACDNGEIFRSNEFNVPVVVRSYIRGDVNNDQDVNIGDISCIANIVLGCIAESYNLNAADVNLDGEINVGDVAYTAEYIINGLFPNTAIMKSPYMLSNNTPRLSASDFEMQTSNEYESTISLISNGNITAFQFDLELPKGLCIKQEFEKECIMQDIHISDSHILGWAEQKSKDLRFVGYSLSNMVFDKGTENLMSIKFVADENMRSGVYPIILKNIIFATKKQTIKLHNQIVNVFVNQATGVKKIVNDTINEDVFNIQGVKLQDRQRGINIINGKKVLIK